MTAVPLKIGRAGWVIFALMTVSLGLIFKDGLAYLGHLWTVNPEYSHAWLIPLIAAFLIWQRRDALERIPFSGSWAGFALVILGLALFAIGELSTLFIIVQYSFLLVLFGAVLAYTGWRPLPLIWAALVLLLFMIPLPDFFYIQLSQKLQLWSSQLGVAVIRLFGISVYLEGNVIDLGSYKLQVVEACSGLRYLFPLMTLGFIAALFFRAPLWKRFILFLSTIPITVLMNSFRIGMIGILVDRYGTAQAEGFLHDFEGWVVFMACFALLFAEMWLLAGKRPLREIFAVDLPPRVPRQRLLEVRAVPAPAWAAMGVLAVATAPALLLPQRVEGVPPRTEFSEFPMHVAAWDGRREAMESVYVDALKFSDYLMADYTREGREGVNFYVAYYESQRKGESAHSPRVCLPGGGWVIEQFGRRAVHDASGHTVPVNRVLITHGEDRQLVYYWFQQRGRIITNEYLVKWYLLWDSITRNRSDGSLVRLITPVRPGGSEHRADEVLQDFARSVTPLLARYVPN